MSWLHLSEIARMADGTLIGEDAAVDAVCTDTRCLRPGQVFIALQGERFDAHEFIDDALPAAGVMVSRETRSSLPQVRVEDTLAALARLAAAWRKRLELPVAGLTGSNGKTTVKTLIASVLSRHTGSKAAVLATRGNLNNHIGVPLTLLALRREHRAAVVEMGANHAGEIAALTQLAAPRVALVTNAGAAHLEGFGDVAGVARAKGEIFQGLPPDGVAVINADDAYAEYWRGLLEGRQCLTFGIERLADIGGRWRAGKPLLIATPQGEIEVELPLEGRHNALNALAATAVCHALGVPLADIQAGLEAPSRMRGRLEARPALHGAQLIDDSYNANPGSLAAGLDVLAARPGRRVLVLGDMQELGADSESLHRAAGRDARELGIEQLLALGPLARAAAKEFGAGGESFEQVEDLIEHLRALLTPSVHVLIKGSRGMHMERVTEALLTQSGSAGGGKQYAA